MLASESRTWATGNRSSSPQKDHLEDIRDTLMDSLDVLWTTSPNIDYSLGTIDAFWYAFSS